MSHPKTWHCIQRASACPSTTSSSSLLLLLLLPLLHIQLTTDHSLPLPPLVFNCGSLQLSFLLPLSHAVPKCFYSPHAVCTLPHPQQETRSSASTLFRYVGPMFSQQYEPVASLVSSPCGLPDRNSFRSRVRRCAATLVALRSPPLCPPEPINSNAANTTPPGSSKNNSTSLNPQHQSVLAKHQTISPCLLPSPLE